MRGWGEGPPPLAGGSSRPPPLTPPRRPAEGLSSFPLPPLRAGPAEGATPVTPARSAPAARCRRCPGNGLRDAGRDAAAGWLAGWLPARPPRSLLPSGGGRPAGAVSTGRRGWGRQPAVLPAAVGRGAGATDPRPARLGAAWLPHGGEAAGGNQAVAASRPGGRRAPGCRARCRALPVRDKCPEVLFYRPPREGFGGCCWLGPGPASGRGGEAGSRGCAARASGLRRRGGRAGPSPRGGGPAPSSLLRRWAGGRQRLPARVQGGLNSQRAAGGTPRSSSFAALSWQNEPKQLSLSSGGCTFGGV